MKIGNLFDLLTDARDVLEFFEGCHNREQLVSRLERLKRQGSEELMECIDGLRVSVDRTFEDTLEMSASLDDKDDDVADNDIDKELEELVGKLDAERLESETPEAPTAEPGANDQDREPILPTGDQKNDATNST